MRGGSTEPKKIDTLQLLSLSNPTIHYETAKEEPQTADDVIFFSVIATTIITGTFHKL